MRGTPVLAVLATALLLGQRPALAQVGYFGSTSIVSSTSDSGDRFRSWYLVNSVDVTAGPVRVAALVPFVVQELTWTDPTLFGTQTVRQTGVGDPVFRVDAEVIGGGRSAMRLQIGAAVKIPVRNTESGLGSGKVDAAFGTTLSGAWGRNTTLIDVTYWVIGDSPELPLRNVPAVYVGYGRVLDRSYRWSVVAAASSSSSLVAGLPASTLVSVTAMRVVSARAGLGLTVGIGLTDSAPDLSLGASWRVELRPPGGGPASQ